MNPTHYQSRKVPGPCRSCLRGGPRDPCPIGCGPLFRFRKRRPDPSPEARGFRAWQEGRDRYSNPFDPDSREGRAWLWGHELARDEHEDGPSGTGARRGRRRAA